MNTPDSRGTAAEDSLQVAEELRRASPRVSEHVSVLPDRIRGDALRRSLYYCTLGWVFGAFWFSATTGATINRFAEYLAPPHLKDLILGFVFGAMFLGVIFQIPGAFVIEHLGRRKQFFITWLTTMRVIYLAIGLLPWLFPMHSLAGAWLLVVLLIVAWSAGQFGGQAWVNWMADMVPQRVRGKYFGRRSRVGIVVMAFTALLMGVVLDMYAGTPQNPQPLDQLVKVISIIFIVAAIAGIVDIQIFHKVDEPRMSAISREPWLQRLFKPFKDGEFRRYVTYLSLWNFSQGWTGAFWWAYLLSFFDVLIAQKSTNWWLNHYYLAAYIMLPLGYNVGQFVGYPVWGRMIDRFGRKPIIFISSFTHTFTWIFWLFLSPALLPWCILAQFIGGFFGSGQEIANFNMMLGFNRKGGPGYQAVASVIINLTAALAAMLAGAFLWYLIRIEESYGTAANLGVLTLSRYQVIILTGIALKIGDDIVLLTRVHDISAKPTAHAVRFLVENIYGNMDTLIFTKIRAIPHATSGAMRKVGGVTSDAMRHLNEATEDTLESVRRIFRTDDSHCWRKTTPEPDTPHQAPTPTPPPQQTIPKSA
jgi:MFS family permease